MHRQKVIRPRNVFEQQKVDKSDEGCLTEVVRVSFADLLSPNLGKHNVEQRRVFATVEVNRREKCILVGVKTTDLHLQPQPAPRYSNVSLIAWYSNRPTR